MRILVALSTAALMLWTAGPAQAQWDLYNNDSPRWKMEASGMALDREGDDNGIPLITNSLTLETLFNSGNATDLNTAPAMDISLQFFTHYGMEMEIEGGFAHWENEFEFLGPNLSTPFAFGFSPDFITYEYDSDLFSLEVNSRQEITPGLTFLLGPRFIYLFEEVEVDTTTIIVPPAPLPIFDFNTTNTIHTKNPLFGAQIGAEWDFLVTRDIHFHSFAKVGGYANFSSAFLATTATGFDPTASDRTKSAGSFVGELGGKVYFTVWPSACEFFVGYEAMWIDNVALAPIQFTTFNNPNDDVILGVTPFFHGASFGVQFLR